MRTSQKSTHITKSQRTKSLCCIATRDRPTSHQSQEHKVTQSKSYEEGSNTKYCN